MRNRLPIVYLVDSAGVNLPYQDGIFPGQYGAGRIFYYNSLMRRKLRIPQIAAVMGPCIAGGAYLPALSDVIFMVEGTSFMGLGGPNLVKGATGQVIDAEPLGGARLHTASAASRTIWRRMTPIASARSASVFDCCPSPSARVSPPAPGARSVGPVRSPARRPPPAVRHGRGDLPHFRCRRLSRVSARARARECCARTRGWRAGRWRLIANRRGFLKSEGRPRIGGIIYTESARKVGVLRRDMRAQRAPADLSAGRLRLHGGAGSRARRHHSRRRGDGGDHGLRHRAERSWSR